jgi:hypothetical protein
VNREHDLNAEIRDGLKNRDVRAAATEHDIRRKISAAMMPRMAALGLTSEQACKRMGIPQAQLRRVLGLEVGGLLTLDVILRAADVLGLHVTLDVFPKDQENP